MTNTWGAIQRGIVNTDFSDYSVLKDDLYGTFSHSNKTTIYRYNEETNSWEEIKASPSKQADCYPCVVNDEQFLYIIGGRNFDWRCSVLSTTRRFDSINNKWEEVAGINEKRYMHFGATMNGKVFIAGGRDTDHNLISSCEVYNPATNEWQLMPSLKVPRADASMVCFQGRLYVMGGLTVAPNDKVVRALTVEMFDLERNEWTEISAIPVKSFETQEEVKKGCKFKACFARLYKGVINKLKPLN